MIDVQHTAGCSARDQRPLTFRVGCITLTESVSGCIGSSPPGSGGRTRGSLITMQQNAAGPGSGPQTADGRPAGQDRPAARCPVTLATQKLQLAVTMTGGVSLAVWMGGVAREVNLLTQASDLRIRGEGEPAVPVPSGPPPGSPADRVRDLYGQLLDLMDLTASVDVLSGTSAGGVNAAILGLANARRLDIGALRDLWLQAGAFGQLLRDPQAEPNPPSLLKGDGQLLTALSSGLDTLAGHSRAAYPAADARDTTVHITTTLLHGQAGQFTDDYGNSVYDADSHGLFTFTEDQLADPGAMAALALAARSSASFPAAFEPSFVPIGAGAAASVPASAPGPHPDMTAYADNIMQSSWVADGGLLANRPLGPLLQSVLARPADREVRRVLLFVVPTTGAPAPPPAAVFAQPYGLGESLRLDLDAMMNQSIAADLDAIVRHNDQVASLAGMRLLFARLAGTGPLADEQMWSDYRTVETAAVVAPVAEAIAAHMAARAAWQPLLGPGGRASARIRDALAAARAGLPVPPQDLADVVQLGQPAYESARAVVLDLIYAAYQLAQRADGGTNAATIERIAAAQQRLNSFSFGSADLARTVVPALMQHAPGTEPSPQEMDAALTSLATDVQARLAENTGATPDKLRPGWQSLLRALTDVAAVAGPLAGVPATGPAGGLRPASPATAAAAHGISPQTAADQRLSLAAAVRDYLTFLGLPGPGRPAPQPGDDQLALRLAELHAAQRSTTPVGALTEQRLELIQASADTRTLLAPNRRSAADKLTGLQLHHFAAFYKGTWRANDWMWGRLDGAGWLAQLLLDPRRMRAVAEAQRAAHPGVSGAAWFYERLAAIAGPPGSDAAAFGIDETVLRARLAFLDDPGETVPPSLPEVALWVALAVQRYIAAEELPALADQIRNRADGVPHAPAQGWLEAFDTALTGKPPAGQDGGILSAQNIYQRLAKIPPGKRIGTFLGSLETLLGQAPAGVRQQVSKELAFLEKDGPPVAASLTALQSWAGEHLAAAAQQGLQRPVFDEAWVGRVAATLRSCPIPDEKLQGEAGTPLFTRTVTQALAVTTAAGTATSGKPPATLAPAISTARTATTAAYLVTARTGAGARTLIALGLLGLGVGIAAMFVSVPLVGTVGLAVLFAGAILLGIGLWRRSIYVAGFVVAAAVALIAAAPWLPWVHQHLFSWLTRTAVPFLDHHAWAWTALFLLVLLPPVWMLAGEFTRRRQRRTDTALARKAATQAAGNAGQPGVPGAGTPGQPAGGTAGLVPAPALPAGSPARHGG